MNLSAPIESNYSETHSGVLNDIAHCADELDVLMRLGAELVELLAPIGDDEDARALTDWLVDDLACQRALLASFRQQTNRS